jgi:hypothetical protein
MPFALIAVSTSSLIQNQTPAQHAKPTTQRQGDWLKIAAAESREEPSTTMPLTA